METNGRDIVHDAIQKCQVIRWFGLVYGDMKRPEGEDGIDKKRPAKASLRLSALQSYSARDKGTCLVARCCPGHTLDDL